MYRTLIVDDEPLMRQYLNANLSTICPSFAVTGIACDGLEAVDKLGKQEYDLVITDIKMPEMDGLSLAKYMFDSGLKTKIIIISGYNEFEYARSAIRYGVSDYLLKPLSDDVMKETLQKIKSDLDLSYSKRNSSASANDYNHCSDYEIKCALLSALLSGNEISIQSIYNIVQERKIRFAKAHVSVMLLCLDELHLLLQERKAIENTSYKLELHMLCGEYCRSHDYSVTFDEKGYVLILISADQETDISAMVGTIYSELVKAWRYDNIKITSSYGLVVADFINLSGSYSSAVESLALTLKNVPSPIAPTYYISQSKFMQELDIICDALYTDYISRNSNKMLADLYLYITLFQDTVNIASILRYGAYLIRYLVNKCNIKADYFLAAFRELTEHIDQEMKTNRFDKESIHALFLRVLKVLEYEETLNLIPETTKIVERAKEFICTHYNEQISLAMVADHLNVNSSYLSDLFHKSIGEPYTKFLTRIRMEQALLILKSNPNEKIYLIAEKTGFVSSKHFNSVFKKYYGFTPTDYIHRKTD
jgi:YesN/AraC family two-component response regulator